MDRKLRGFHSLNKNWKFYGRSIFYEDLQDFKLFSEFSVIFTPENSWLQSDCQDIKVNTLKVTEEEHF